MGTVTITGDLTVSGDTRADNFLVDTSTVINDAALTINDANRYIWTPYSGWGEYWDTTNNQVDFYGSGTERAYIDLDDGNAYFAGTVTGASFSGAGTGLTGTAPV